MNIQGAELFDNSLNLRSEFAYDIGVIPSGVTQPIPLKIDFIIKNSSV